MQNSMRYTVCTIKTVLGQYYAQSLIKSPVCIQIMFCMYALHVRMYLPQCDLRKCCSRSLAQPPSSRWPLTSTHSLHPAHTQQKVVLSGPHLEAKELQLHLSDKIGIAGVNTFTPVGIKSFPPKNCPPWSHTDWLHTDWLHLVWAHGVRPASRPLQSGHTTLVSHTTYVG